MIVVRLMGGLGNQLFQYAAGRRIALKHQTELKLDTTVYNSHPFKLNTPARRWYELPPFNIEASIASWRDLAHTQGHPFYLLHFLGRHPPLSHIREKHFHFDQGILRLPDNVYLDGFWQSERYFHDIAEIIRKDFTVHERPKGENTKLLQEMRRTSAIALHIRRGDYVFDPKTRQYHGICSPSYYQQGVRLLAQRVKHPSLYVFSDDPEWCRQNIRLDYPTRYVDHNRPNKGYEDLRLMSHCQHFVIANSSFSWWGAWLSTNHNKIVIAPHRWFAEPGNNTKDLLPRSWIKL